MAVATSRTHSVAEHGSPDPRLSSPFPLLPPPSPPPRGCCAACSRPNSPTRFSGVGVAVGMGHATPTSSSSRSSGAACPYNIYFFMSFRWTKQRKYQQVEGGGEGREGRDQTSKGTLSQTRGGNLELGMGGEEGRADETGGERASFNDFLFFFFCLECLFALVTKNNMVAKIKACTVCCSSSTARLGSTLQLGASSRLAGEASHCSNGAEAHGTQATLPPNPQKHGHGRPANKDRTKSA